MFCILASVSVRNGVAYAQRDRLITRLRQDQSSRKIFVHGLPYDTTEETLATVFQEHGSLESTQLVKDQVCLALFLAVVLMVSVLAQNGRCKGYAFVVYNDADGAARCLEQPSKRVGDREVKYNLASDRILERVRC